jgi:hypothetical protein
VATGSERAPARPLPRAAIAIVAAVVVVAAAGYWWLNRPPGRYKPDNGGLYPISVNGKYGFMDRSGKTIITPQFDGTVGFSEGLASVRIGTKWGYINTKGVVAITPQFDSAMSFRYGRARVQLANRYGYVDKEGKYIGSPTFLWASEFSGEFAAVQTADRALALVNQSGKTVLLANVDTLGPPFNSGLLPAASGGKWGFMDTTGKWVIDPQFEGVAGFADGLAPVLVGGRWGYIDQKGKFVVNPQYDGCGEFYEGYANFLSSGKWGFIDTKGRVVSDAKFLAAFPFSDGLASVQTEDGWGFIDRTGKMAISPQFDSASMFQNGLAQVGVGGKEAYVTMTGAFVVDPFPGRAGIPAHRVQEIWEGDINISETAKFHQRLILVREGTTIRGYHDVVLGANQVHKLIDLRGQAAQDRSFNITDEDGASWKGQFVSAVLIKGVAVNWRLGPPERATNEYPMRLRLARDATDNEIPAPLPPTSSDWPAFLSSFKDAAQRRDSGLLAGMMTRNFYLQDQSFQTPAEALARLNWDQLDKALARGVEGSSSTPWGKAQHSIVDEQPCPKCVFQVKIVFSQDGDNQWRWAGVVYPGDVPPQPDSSSIVTGLAAANMIIAANPDVEVLNTNDRQRTITVREKKTGRVVTMTFDEAKGAFEKRR